MPELYIEDPDDEFDYETDWKEAIDITQPGGGDVTSATSQEAVLVGYVPFNKVRSAERYFLGYSYADDAAPWKLHREPPARHPRKPSLYAYTVSSLGFVPQSNEENENREPYVESPFAGSLDETLWNADYQRALMTVRYKSFGRMRFLADSFITDYTDEWKRMTRWSASPAVEALQADGIAQLKFAEGAPSTAGPDGAALAFPAPLASLLSKVGMVLRWYAVPSEYVSSDSFIFIPDQILALLGTVNEEPFLGFSKGTMLLKAVSAEETLFPVHPLDPFDIVGGYDITLMWEHYDPPKGETSSEYRGHRIFPYRIDGKHYYCTRENGTDELLPLADHFKVFQHVGDTA